MSETRTESAVSPAAEDRSLSELMSLATKDISHLVRYEVELAKAELRGDVKRIGVGAGMFGSAGFLGYFAVVFLSVALGLGLVAVGLPLWAAFLIVGGGYLVLAAVVALIGLLNLRRMSKGRRTMQSMRANMALLKRSGAAAEAPER